ncbi:PEBP-like protein [Leucogyrophana mollusca]|uniref:PEBP-like protein n=1 Tax=Leucogyrophana mollusca TaxID=85980 RepID=A0ACB8BZD1_9AGAM|nr:PEBP-like protein [Leucogyrophana mollusca]
MISLSVILSLALIPFVQAQSNDPVLDIAAIQAHFSGSGLVPSLLPSFNPSAVLTVSYSGVGNISPGQALTQTQVKPAPSLSLTPANSSVSFTGKYTLVMADAGPPGTDETKGQTRHWLVNGVTVAGNTISIEGGTAITQYAGPAPPSGSGAHRYAVLLFSQPAMFTPPTGFSQPNMGVSVFNLEDYVTSANLGTPIAGNYLTVEEGTATFSASPTSAVVSSTLSGMAASKPSSPSTSAGGAVAQTPHANSAAASAGGSFAVILTSIFGLLAV